MRLPSVVPWLVAAAQVLSGSAQDSSEAETFQYQSDIARLRSIVIHSLYSQKDVFARELLSNANDALEKLRLVSLRDRAVMEGLGAKGGWEGNITIEARKYGDRPGGELVFRDTGIGMSKHELATNLGTIAKSGTAEFLKKAAGTDDSNLIGQFGLGFYSVFLVSDTARVSSLPPPTADAPNPRQHTFTSSASGESFTVEPDPRGTTLWPCGTEIVLEINEEGAKEGWLDEEKLRALVERHSQYSTVFPIYLLDHSEKAAVAEDGDEEEAEAEAEAQAAEDGRWVRINDRAPLWMREPKSVSEEEYHAFYSALVKKPAATPLGYSHFKGDSGAGVSYRGLIYLPEDLPREFWEKATETLRNVRLMVKRVFITDDLGPEFLPRWLAFLRVVVDADDLPLNVSRETLQTNKFVRQLSRIIFRKALDMFAKIAHDDPEAFEKVSKVYGNALRIGLIETKDKKDKVKLADLLRFETTKNNFTSLEEYVTNRRGNQKQIYYIASVGETAKTLSRSPFVEKLQARGYEVLLLNQPADEAMMQSLSSYKGLKVQDVSNRGLKFGDEEEDAAETAEFEASKKAFAPLLSWLKSQLTGRVSDVVLTNRLVSSPCTLVTDYGFSANMARLMAANVREDDPMYKMMMNAPKILEINPKSPLIEGLLERVMDLPPVEEDSDPSADERDLADLVQVLFDTTAVKSGFTVEDTNDYFDRIESLLRQSLGVSLSAKGSASYKPAPPIATGPLPEDDAETPDLGSMFGGGGPADDANFVDWSKLKDQIKDGMPSEELEGLFGENGAATTHDEL